MSKNPRTELVFSPDWSRDNPYQKLLYASIDRLGVSCRGLAGRDFTLKWLHENKNTVRFLHFHWLFGIYDPGNSGLDLRKTRGFLFKITVAKLLGYKILWTVHNLISHEPSHLKLEILVRKAVARLADHVIVHCNYARDLIHKEWGIGPGKITVIPHGSYIGYYPNDISRNEARQRLGLSEDDFIFLFFGMIRNYKGMKQLLESFGEVNSINPKTRLVMAGKPFNDTIRSELEAMARSKRISTFLGYIPDEEVQLFFNAADVVVLPYQNILTSGAAILALSFGKPLIVPNKGCIPELINDENGFLYHHDRELTETMLRAVRKTHGKKYGGHVVENLCWQRLAEEKYRPLLTTGRQEAATDVDNVTGETALELFNKQAKPTREKNGQSDSGDFGVKCNICGWAGEKFDPMIAPSYTRDNSICPACGSLERHRGLIYYLESHKPATGIKILDFAPISSFKKYFESRGYLYLTSDLHRDGVDIKCDIQNIPLEAKSIDVIICYHLLEHVRDDIKALSELYRILNDDGIIYIQVGGTALNTRETIEFGEPNPLDHDHMRRYGIDIVDRIKNIGFVVEMMDFSQKADPDLSRKFGFDKACYPTFICVKNEISDKAHHELAFWRDKKKDEGTLTNRHYEYFYTKQFDFDIEFYANKKILDIGCGPRGSLEWADVALERIGLDPLSDSYRELGTYKHKMQYIAAHSENIPFPDNYFDIITSFNSLDHVNNLDRTISEIKRTLKQGGIFLLLTEVNHKPTVCEPISFTWDIVNKFKDTFLLVDETHYERTADGMYNSILKNVTYDSSDITERYGILSAKFIKNNPAGWVSDCRVNDTTGVRVSVIMCTYNRDHMLGDSILAVQRQDFPSNLYEIVVVDNNSTDCTKSIVEQIATMSPVRIKYLFEGNQGLSFARNTGISNAEGEIIVFTDDDINAEHNWLRELVSAFDSPDIACAGGPIRPIWPFPKPDWLTERWQGPLTISDFKPAQESGEFKGPYYPWGANIAFRKEVFAAIGLFPIDLGRIGNCLLSNEEVNLCRKIEASGKRIKFVPNAVIHHKISPERIRKIWLYHRNYWQGRSNAVLDIDTGKNIYAQLRNNMAKLQQTAADKNLCNFERKCINRVLFGYLHQLIEGTQRKGRAETIRRIRTLKQIINIIETDSQESIRFYNEQLNSDAAVIKALEEKVRVLTFQIGSESELSLSLREIIQQKDEHIEALYNSLSWRMTKPLRSAYDLIRKFLPTG